jgi:UDP-glucose 4-epimerase
MKSSGVGKLVLSSSAATYGVAQVETITETHPQEPINPYGATKLKAEGLVLQAVKQGSIRAGVLRYFNVIGHDPAGELWEDHNPESHLLPNILKGLDSGKTFELFGTDYATPDGTCVRDYVDVNDLGQAHLAALAELEQKEKLVSNVGSGRGHSVREVFKAFKDTVGKAPTLVENLADPVIRHSWWQTQSFLNLGTKNPCDRLKRVSKAFSFNITRVCLG